MGVKHTLRRKVGCKRVEVTGGWQKLHYEEHHNLYSSQIIIRVRWVEHEACVGGERCIQNFSWKTWKEETTWKV